MAARPASEQSRPKARWSRWLLAMLLPFVAHAGDRTSAQPPAAPPAIIADIDRGNFRDAQATIDRLLANPGLAEADRTALLFQRERMRRILLDFTLDRAALATRVRRLIPDLREDEFSRWDRDGLFERMTIDGRVLYFNRSAGNLIQLSPEARGRRAVQAPLAQGPMESLHPRHRSIHAATLASGNSSVLPIRVRMTQTLTVAADAVPAGKAVRAWIPYPLEIPGQQEAVRYVASIPARHELPGEPGPQRTIHLELPAQSGRETRFSVTYEVTLFAQDHRLDPGRAEPITLTPALAPYVEELAPHVVFTPAMRAFSERIVGDERNPYRIAQKLFAAVDTIPWAGAREYSTISNISDYALHAGHADCGQQTLLLITLLRLNGIPARWQSGMVFSDDGSGYDNIHDWGFVYLPPWGWVPMDVTTGQLDGNLPGDADLRWFYLGGLDNWRIAFNSDFGRAFQPPKRHFRSDTVDSQRGEAEWDGGNIYFDQLDYRFDWRVLSERQRHTTH